jgi:hypothetical protein
VKPLSWKQVAQIRDTRSRPVPIGLPPIGYSDTNYERKPAPFRLARGHLDLALFRQESSELPSRARGTLLAQKCGPIVENAYGHSIKEIKANALENQQHEIKYEKESSFADNPAASLVGGHAGVLHFRPRFCSKQSHRL